MAFTDAYGIWETITENYAPATDWELFQFPLNNSTLFRFEFDCNWAKWNTPYAGYKSYGLLRFHYQDDAGGFSYVESQKRIYPQQQVLLRSFPIIEEVSDNPWAVRKAAIRRKFYTRSTWVENHPEVDIPWTVTVHALTNNT